MAWKKVETASSVPDSLGRPNTVETWMLPDRDDVAVATITKDADDAVAMTVGGETVQTGASALTRTTTTVHTNIGTKQALLSAVPTGKVRVVTMVVERNVSADQTLATPGSLTLGFSAGADNWLDDGDVNSLTSTSKTNGLILQTGRNVGLAGEIFGVIIGSDITATLDIDTFYYDIDA